MNLNEIFQQLKCALTNDHIVREPIHLGCGHCICKLCIPIIDKIECQICGVVTNKNLRNESESILINAMIKFHLAGLYADLEEKTTKQLTKFNDLLVNREKLLDLNLKSIEDEIESRILWLKNELDEIFLQFKNELKKIKTDIIKSYSKEIRSDIKELENKLNELHVNTEENRLRNEEAFYEYQENLKNLKQLISQFEGTFQNFGLELTLSSEKMNKSTVGELIYNGNKEFCSINREKVQDILLNAQYEEISVDVNPYEICVLPGNHFITTNSDSLTIFNEHFKQIKKFEISTGHVFGCSVSDRNQIYISNHHIHSIIILDLNLNVLKAFGSKGSNNDQFHFPTSLCCKDKYLYICDSANKRIQKFDLDLQYRDTIKLNFRPYSIKVSNENDVCMITGPNGINFYDLKTKNLKYQYPNQFGRISYVNSNFYIVSNQPKKRAYCYNNSGQFIQEINIERFSEFIRCDWDGLILYARNDLFISSNDSKKILKFT